MPNHVKNKIKAPKDVIEAITNDSGQVDFSLVLPSFNDGLEGGISGNAESLAESCVPFKESGNSMLDRMKVGNMLGSDIKSLSDEQFCDFITMIKNYRDHGYFHCMDFNREEWGTKWNAYNCDIKGETASFETAWSHPYPVIKKLSEMFPDVEIEVKYADEDFGNNLGSYSIKNGEKVFINKIENPDEFAIKLHCGDSAKPEDFERDENWQYIEDC